MPTVLPIPNLAAQLRSLGATEALVKHLAPNDNSKNQIYLAGDITELGLLPIGEIELNPGTTQKPRRGDEPIYRAHIDLWWLTSQGLAPAPNSKLILYPQYPEVRLSGFLLGCRTSPSDYFSNTRRGREPGRILLLAPLVDGRIIAVVFSSDDAEAAALRHVHGEPYGVMQRYDLARDATSETSELLLLSELRRIHRMDWVKPVYLLPDGTFKDCKGPNCGGVTLESHLGIRPNGFSEPDFHGWEVKQHNVTSWEKKGGSIITLMTPEPSGGAYKEEGPEYFVRTWGYPDQRGREDRLNFGGVYRVGGERNNLTGLRLVLSGYDEPTGDFRGDGAVLLVDDNERVAASWSFTKLMDHWKKKHSKAAFVPSMIRKVPEVRYRYGSRITLGEGGRFTHLLRGFAYGSVYYDPGIKIEGASTAKPTMKRRSQFRVNTSRLQYLYESCRDVDL